MELIVKNSNLKFNVSDEIFNVNFNENLVHQVISSYLSNSRKNIKCQKSRSSVSGSNKKPWKQKGTGRARSGSKKSPIWRSGGVTFVSNQNYKKKINKKMYINALRCIFSKYIKNDNLLLVNNLKIDYPKTKILLNELNKLNVCNALIIFKNKNTNLYLSSRNLYNIQIMNVNNIIITKLLKFDKIIITLNSIKYLNDILKWK